MRKMNLNLILSKRAILLFLVFSVPSAIVLGTEFTINSNPSPVGTVTYLGQVYYKLPDGKVGQSYTVAFSTTSPYANTLTWKTYGSLPTGLAPNPSSPSVKSATLTLSGTPTAAGTFYFTVEAKENYPNGATTQSKRYAITINPSETPPPPHRNIDFAIDVVGRLPVVLDLTPLAMGQSAVSVTGYTIKLRKISGDSEMIRLEQTGLPEGVTMYVEGTGIRAPTSLIMENIWLTGELTLSLGFTVSAADNWRSLASSSAPMLYRIVFKARSQTGVEKSVAIGLSISYEIPKLQVISLKPLTQHGSTLIVKKQTIFKLEYKLEYSSPLEVEYRIDLGVLGWMDPSKDFIMGEEWHYGGLRKEGDPPRWVYYGRATLNPTTRGATGVVYLMEEVRQGSGFLPRPSSSGDVQVRVDFDPYRKITWNEGSLTTISETFRVEIYPRRVYDYARRIKVVLWEEDRRFASIHWSEYISEIATPAYWVTVPPRYGHMFETHLPVYRYEVYLSGMFRDYYFIYPVTAWYYRGDIGWWNADTVAEEAAEEGYGRVIAIVPNGDLDGDSIGVVYNANYYFWDQGFHVAFVQYSEAVDTTNTKHLYFPVVAHELSHTFRFPDIYDGYDIVVPEECVYFDEFQGGVIKVFKYQGTPYFHAGESIRYWDPARGRWVELPNPSDVIARDIMDYLKDSRDVYWAWASWKAVGGLSGDDPETLLISMAIFRNGTVLGRPFQRLYNYSWSYLEPEGGTGNFSLTLYLKDGTVFKRYPYNISFYYFTDPGGYELADAIPFVRIVPWTDNLGKIELTGPGGKVWFTRSVSTHAPTLEILYPPEGKKLGAGRDYTIIWKGSDADGDQLWYTVLIRGKGEETWRILANRITKDRITLGVPTVSEDGTLERVYTDPSSAKLGGSEFPEGDYEIQIKATDGVNTAVKVVRVQIVKPEQIKTYTLKVSSNVGLKIEGSGTYEEGDTVKVKAPIEEPMKGLLGALGGKYQFNRWTGAVESKKSEVVVRMTGEQTILTITAIYEENYTQAYLILGAIAAVVLAVVVLTALSLKRKPKPLPPPPP